MQKAAAFIVRRRRSVMTFMLLLTVLCGFLAMKVHINEDMTEYLPDSSSMKQGMDIMSEEFPETESDSSIRVMIENLTDTEKKEVLESLENLSNVTSVDYDNTEDYNKDNQTLYIVNTGCDYGSDEEILLESQIAESMDGYTYVLKNNDSSAEGIPTYIMLAALGILMIVLWIMCGSWIEPFLFLLTIGFAVIINAGTNYFLGSVSSITNMICALLQLVLSMDYSIILMNRYRQELLWNENPVEAMSVALGHAFSSISSSAVTTIVGLLSLVFMSFKIGMDLGIVLAKGVLISMICVFTFLPGLILMCSRLIQKTSKKVPHIPMGGLGRFSYRFRMPVAVAFVLLFIAGYFLQGNTQTAFTLESEDPIAEVFPNSNTIVLVYQEQDDAAVTEIAEDLLEQDDKVKAAVSYSTMLGKPYTVNEMKDAISAMSEEISFDPELLKILYYDYYCHDDSVSITASEFLHFLSEDVLKNEQFANELDDNMKENVDLMMEFADEDKLTEKKSISELADIFGMDTGTVEKLLLLYYTSHDGANTGSMTLPVFANFVAKEVAKNPEYSSMFDKSTLSMMDTLLTFTDTKKMTEPRTYKGIASLLGIEKENAKLLFVYYKALEDGYDPGSMTMAEFTDLIQNKVAKDPAFSGYLDKNTVNQVAVLGNFTSKKEIQAQKNSKQLSQMFGIDQTMIDQLFLTAFPADVTDKTMSLAEFTSFLVNDILNDPVYSAQFDDTMKAQISQMSQMMESMPSDQQMTAAQLAQTLGMKEEMVKQLFVIHFTDTKSCTMSAVQFVDFLLGDVSGKLDKSMLNQLKMIQNIMQGTLKDKSYTYGKMAELLGMDKSMLKILYTYRNSSKDISNWKISMQTMVHFLVDNKEQFASVMGSNINQLTLLKNLIDHSISKTSYTYQSLAKLLGMNSTQLRQLYLLYQTEHGDTGNWGISLYKFVEFIQNEVLTNKQYAGQMDQNAANMLTGARTLMDAVISGEKYDAEGFAKLFEGLTEELDENKMGLLMMLYGGQNLYQSEWTMSVSQLFNYLNDSILKDTRFEDLIDEKMRTSIAENQSTIDEAIAQLKGENYSRLILSTVYSDESEETSDFIGNLVQLCDKNLDGEYHLIGSSVMNYEMEHSFDREMLMITLITALAIFVVVALTFKSLIIPVILVLLVQCGVFITVTTIGIQGYSIYYLALLIVQSILMGATIDYGILYTNYYLEHRQNMTVKEALIAAYNGSIHTILTSGLILILVTGIVGNLFSNPTIGQICKTISTGALSASLLILFMLPAILAALDRLIIRKKKI